LHVSTGRRSGTRSAAGDDRRDRVVRPFEAGRQVPDRCQAHRTCCSSDRRGVGSRGRFGVSRRDGDDVDPSRELFSLSLDERSRGYKPGRFSFNVKGGRIVAQGTPENVAAVGASFTGHYLAPLLGVPRAKAS
jgi:hypothetical protein